MMAMEYTRLDAPEHVPTVFVEAWNNRDPDTLASIFDEDAEFVNVTGLWWDNRESIRKAHAYGLQHIFSRSTLRMTKRTIKQLSDEVAVVPCPNDARESNAGRGSQGAEASVEHLLIRRPPNDEWMALRIGSQYRRRAADGNQHHR